MDVAIPLRRLVWPLIGALLAAGTLLAIVAFDQGVLGTAVTNLAADSGGVLHEVFHDARHLLGVPCH